MSEITRRAQSTLLPDFPALIDPFGLLAAWRTAGTAHGISVETGFEDGAFVVRAEIPGVDPRKDVEVTVSDELLTIRAERSETTEGKHHSEFRYGSFSRSLRLPEDCEPAKTTAAYHDGILTIRVKTAKSAKTPVHRIAVTAEESDT